jgi:DNA (cytosine-5)-methyltransferase 1
MSRPKLLDLFCGAGGAGMGYHLAGFDVVGVDLNPMPNYPFEFHQGDALDYLKAHWFEFDALHSSPPCQASSALTKGTNAGREYPQLIPATRAALLATGLPTVMENVQGSDLRRDLTLCGEMFSLDVIRHRYFEVTFPVTQPKHVAHRGRVAGMRHGEWFTGPYFAVYGDGGGKGTVAQWQAAMGIEWTNVRKEIAEAIPPAYTEWLGAQMLAHIESEAVA